MPPRSPKIGWRGRLLAGLALPLVAAAPAARAQWPESDNTCRPWAFNWWMGSAVDKDNLSRELKRYREAGMGGIHIIPIYGAKGAESRFIAYLSPRWMEMMGFAVEEGKKLGLQVDMTTGTGWCFGGPGITSELGGCKVVVQAFPAPRDGKLPSKLASQKVKLEAAQAIGPDGQRKAIGFTSEGALDWTPPGEGWRVIALGHEPTDWKVKRAAPGGEGRMINPFNPEAMRVFLEPFTAAFNRPGVQKPRAMFHDSYEYYGTDWAPNFLAAFEKYRGYRLQDELEAFAGLGDPDRAARVRCDYRQTLSDLLIKDTFSLWANWCNQRGILTRNQAHGAPVNLLDFYALADIPETEMFGHGGPDPLVSRFDENIGKADRDPLVSKFASSAAHVTGKPRVSSETGTWLAEHFCESFEELKGLVDLLFLSGVNHVIYHGCVYSPDDAAWPGWVFYAATQMNPRNPLWREAPTLNGYIERCQSVFRDGHPDNDVLLYWPIHDLWNHDKLFQFSVHKREWLTSEPVGAAARRLWSRGYGFDYVSDALLQPIKADGNFIDGPDHTTWRAVVVPACRQMPIQTLEKLLGLAAQGATVVFEKELPADVPGLADLEARRKQLREIVSQLSFRDLPEGGRQAAVGKGRLLVGSLEEALRSAGISRETLVDRPGLKFIRRKKGEDRVYFLVNQNTCPLDAWIPLANPCSSAIAMDPLTGNIGSALVRAGTSGNSEVRLRIEPGHSLILRLPSKSGSKEAGAPFVFARPGSEAIEIKGPWQVSFLAGGPTLPKAYQAAELKSWTENGDPATESFAGTALYRTTFDCDSNAKSSLLLDLGEVRQVCLVRLNGQTLGSLIMHPFRIIIPAGTLKARGNQLEVEVTNLGANRIRDLDRRKVPWRIFYDANFASINHKPFDASNWPILESGLLGPVKLLNFGADSPF